MFKGGKWKDAKSKWDRFGQEGHFLEMKKQRMHIYTEYINRHGKHLSDSSEATNLHRYLNWPLFGT